MRTAQPLGLSPDGSSLIVVLEGGEQVAIPADDRLRAALRNDRARLGQLEIDMDSALRPREIQARIRAGESLEEVALAAGVPAEQIAPFALPVIAEREHVAGMAQQNPVRRSGDAVAHRSLRSVVSDRLLSRGVDVDTAEWDAWKVGERRWNVRLSYDSGSAHREADFSYDQTGRFSVAANDDARWLTGEHSSSHGPQPGRRKRADDPDQEATLDLNDELAIVRAIQPQFSVTPVVPDDDEDDQTPDNEDAYAEGDLEEVDGVYDIVPGDRSNMDVLYDMLSSFDEDSVQIYAGLVRPTEDERPAPVLDEGPAEPAASDPETDDDGTAAAPPTTTAVPEPTVADDSDDQDDSDDYASDAVDASDEQAEPEDQPEQPLEPEPTPAEEPTDTAEPTPPPPAAQAADEDDRVITEPEQPSLVEEPVNEPSRPIKRKRASVPSWDEIMFGSPQPKD